MKKNLGIVRSCEPQFLQAKQKLQKKKNRFQPLPSKELSEMSEGNN